jgi:tetratricopeptide (TPR) repeat protein
MLEEPVNLMNSDEAEALTNQGVIYLRQQQWEEAIACFQTSLTFFQLQGDRVSVGANLTNLGLAYEQLGRIEETIRAHEEALSIFETEGDRESEAKALTNLAKIYGDRQDFDRAIAFLKWDLAISEALGDRPPPDKPKRCITWGYITDARGASLKWCPVFPKAC